MTRGKIRSLPTPQHEPVTSAQAAGLRYCTDTHPGIRRQQKGEKFWYQGVDGRCVRDPDTLRRITLLVIPPAWTNVWICPDANGHLQATGRDNKGRKQYRYHPRWRVIRDETKYGRLLSFAQVLPRIRQQVTRDLTLPGLPRDKVLATVVHLLDTTYIRIGNAEYARTNQSYGLTTMRDRHVEIRGATLRFRFRGKSGKDHSIIINDRRLASIVRRCQELPGYELFQYVDPQGQSQTIASGDVNDYLRTVSGQNYTAKDFRTWAGTLLATRALHECGVGTSQRQIKQHIVRAVTQVAERLGNTVAVCRKCYIHPAVLQGYADGSLLTMQVQSEKQRDENIGATWSEEEATLVGFLRRWLTHPQEQLKTAA
jgi:DNA topoisomerase-1